ncbi:hypothetical protein C0992_010437, partial [Termitomyces sp. T32_za158]
MPPRKKATDGVPAVPTRSSARTRAAQAAAVTVAPIPPPPAQAKPKSKRPRANSANAPASEPASKKGKKGKAKEDDSEEAEAESVQKDVADNTVPDEPKKMRDYSDDDNSKDDKKAENKEVVVIPDSKLEPEIQDLCKLIFSTSLIDAHLSSMNYDAKKLPLGINFTLSVVLQVVSPSFSGKLAKSTILSGFAALKTLSEVIEKPNGDVANQYGDFRAACAQLSGAYYSIIPHDFGRQRPKIIDSLQALQEELNLVDALGDMEIASKLISTNLHTDANGAPINPLDANFRSLGLTSMKPVKPDTQEFKTLEAYVRDTHGATHQHLQ